ncbi:hypothetical protein DFS33DRAFT_963302 [Desarmillaria ectypa]|nr:hypothetical protein DFS33DRAFT_963302 [Desarmillaria ectypa]
MWPPASFLAPLTFVGAAPVFILMERWKRENGDFFGGWSSHYRLDRVFIVLVAAKISPDCSCNYKCILSIIHTTPK